MSNYSKTTDFEAKDSLPTGDSGKIIRGAEFETEFDAISTAIATKADTAGPTFTGTLTFETISDGTIGVTAFVDEDDMSSDSATLVPTQQSVKAYVDSQVTAQDLDFQADSGGALSIDLDSETLTFTGGTGIDTSGSGNAVTFAIDSTVATLTGTQTLTNKTLTSPDVNTPDIDGGTIDGTVIGGTTAAAGSFTTVSATGNITVDGTVDGRDVATDGTKLDGIESGATADQTAAEIRTLVDSASDSNVFTDADHSKLDGIEAGADVTDTANVTAAGALMDSELTSEASVKALNQGVATTDSPTFAGVTVNGTVEFDGLSGTGAVSVTDILDQDDMSSNSATALATQQSIKAYVDSQIGSNNELSEVLGNGNTTGGTNIAVGSGDDITFADSSKAIFGAGSDLAVYHNGSNGFVENETGLLILKNNSDDRDVAIQSDDGSGGIANYLLADGSTGALNAYHYGSLKLATTSTGIDVTGTVTADGLTVDASLATVASSGPNVDLILTEGSTNTDARIRNSNGILEIDADLNNEFGNSSIMFAVDGTDKLKINNNGDISFYEDTGTTAKLFWDAAAESLGIGTSSPSTARLQVKGSGTTVSTNAMFAENSSGAGLFAIRDNGDAFILGNTGIGTSSPSNTLHVQTSSSGATPFSTSPLVIERSDVNLISMLSANDTDQGILFGDVADNDIGGLFYLHASNAMTFRTNTAERMRIDSSGNVRVGVGNTFEPTIQFTNSGRVVGNPGYSFNGDLDTGMFNPSTQGTIAFANNGTESMRIDSSGHLLVGTTDSGIYDDATDEAGHNLLANGQYYNSAVSEINMILNKQNSDGDILQFRKDGTAVGSIGAYLGSPYIGTGDTGLLFETTNNRIEPFDTSSLAAEDAAIDLGQQFNRFKDLYLSGGVYLGGTGSANKLDDYEEGTWTPAAANADAYGFTIGTPTGANGNYTKVGRLVTLKGGFTSLDSTDTIVVSDRFGVSGLPFTPSGSYTAGTGAQGSCIVYSSFGSGILATGTVTHTTDKIWIVIDAVHGSPTWGVDVNISISYIVD